MKIEVVGPGCARCVTTEKNVHEALKQLGVNAEVAKLTNVAEFAKKDVMFTPAVIINGQVKISGRIPSVEELRDIISKG